VYDFGGGTFDISILEVGEGVVEVKSTNGDTHLGGDNIDQRVIDWIVSEFKKENGIEPCRATRWALQRLKEASEEGQDGAFHAARNRDQPAFVDGRRLGPQAPANEADAGALRADVEDILQRSMGPCKQAMTDANVTPTQIDEVVLVGGQTRMPRIQALVRELFAKDPHQGVNPE